MKKAAQLIIIGIITGSIGYIIGKSSGYEEAIEYQNYRGIDSIKFDLKEKEKEIISTLLKGSARIETKNEGGFFNRKEVQYFTAEIRNTSLLVRAKDIKVTVTLLSKTQTEIGDIEFTIYEFIEPGQSKTFSKEVNVSDDVSGFQWDVLSALTE